MSQPKPVSPLLQSVTRPHGFEALRVEGQLPEALKGTLYRAGPGIFERFGKRLSHAFEADGAISAVRFDGSGGAEGAVRIVESAGYREEEAAGKYLFTSAASWWDRMRAMRRGASKSTGNTSTFLWQERLYALMEGGLPQEMDRHSLDTLEASDLGVIPGAFSAHPHRVASLKTTFNFGVRYGPKMLIDLFALPDEGPAKKLGTVEAPWQSMVHDFMATEGHLLIFLGPVKLNLFRAMLGLMDFSKLFSWTPELGSRLIAVPLDAIDKPKTFELDAFWTWHFANAFEDGDGISVDLCRYPRFNLEDIGDLQENGPPPMLTRIHLDLKAGTARQSELFDVPVEFPSLHPRLHGQRHRTLFAQTERRTPERLFQGITRIDLEGSRSEWAVPRGHTPSEPVLVTRSEKEDDAFVLTLVHTAKNESAYLAILDGQHLEDGPLATVHFDHPLPLTFHGTFASAV